MKRLKMPLTFRLQNFFLSEDEEPFWISGTHTTLQKIKRFFQRKKTPLCNLSNGVTLPLHGQYVYESKNLIVHYRTGTAFDFGGTVSELKFKPFDDSQISQLSPQYLQGISFKDSAPTFALFHTPAHEAIELHNLATKAKTLIHYGAYRKWFWGEWEAEGVQVQGGSIFVGVTVTTFFGIKLNYLIEEKK